MKTKIITFIIVALTTIGTIAQTQVNKNETTLIQTKVIENDAYKLFPTKNYWTFIKLDTRNGKMWQVHFSVKDDSTQGEFIINSLPLVNKDEEVNGRFTLYPTENIYNFLLLDQIDGKVYQVQWSMDILNRFVFPIN